MSITDELRKWVSNHYSGWSSKQAEGYAIAKRIDERVTELLREQDAALRAEFDAMNDGWVRLPVDADGEPWHIGDRTESGQTIEAMGLNKHGWHFVGTVNEIDPAIHCHHHAPTVEDVLREFARVGIRIGSKDGIEAGKFTFYPDEDMVAEYASKLRLAGDAE